MVTTKSRVAFLQLEIFVYSIKTVLKSTPHLARIFMGNEVIFANEEMGF